MAQRYRDEAGNIWEMGPDGQPHFVSGGALQKPTAQFEVPQAQADLTGKGLGNQKTAFELQQEQATAAATRAKAEAEAQSATLAAKQAQEAYDQAHPKSKGTVFGPDFLNTLSPPDQELVKALAEGRLAFPAGFALKAPWWQQKLQEVAQYDPSFDATNFNNRAKARAMLLTGKVGTSANALNTAIGHAALLDSQIAGTASHGGANSWLPFATTLNSLINAYEHSKGDPGITNFKDTAGKLASELTSVYRNGGGAEADVVRQLQSLDPNASKDQKEGVIRNTLELLASKQAANLYQYGLAGGKPAVDLLDPAARAVLDKFPDIRDKYFGSQTQPLSSAAVALIKANGGTPPSGPPGPNDGGGGRSSGPSGPRLGPVADFSDVPVGPQQTLAQMDPNSPYGVFAPSTKNVPDPTASSKLAAMAHSGASFAAADSYLKSIGNGGARFSPSEWDRYVSYAKQHPDYNNVTVLKSVPTTLGERISSSPGAAAAEGFARAGTAGGVDALGRTLNGPNWDANAQSLAALHPEADLAGNVAGGVSAILGAQSLAERFAPNAAATVASKLGKFAPVAGDMAYGGVYGANESPNDPLGGAFKGAITAGGTGMFARGVTRGLGRTIAPDAGALKPLYDAGVFPTIGQRAAAMTGPISSRVGKAVNTMEQAMQSVPLLGALPAGARQAARNDFQLGAFNNALGELQPLAQYGVKTKLPQGIQPGPESHSFVNEQFNNAYPMVRSGMQFVPDHQYIQDSAAFLNKLNDGTLSGDEAARVQQRIGSAVESRLANSGNFLDGNGYGAASSDLSRTVSQWGRNPSTAPMAHALSEYQTIFDNAARRNSDPLSVKMLDATDKGYANLVRIQRASELGGATKDPGTFTPANYASAAKQMGGGVRSSAYNTGNALGQDYAQAGLKLADTLPDSGTAGRLAALGTMGVGAYSHVLNPATAGMFAPFALGKFGSRLVAPREATLPSFLADPLNSLGNGVYDRAAIAGNFAVPASLSYIMGQ